LSYYFARNKAQLFVFPPGTVLPVGNDGNIFTPHNGIGCLTANIPSIGCVTTFSDGLIGNPENDSIIPKLNTIAHFNGLKDHQIRLNLGIKKEELKASETKNFGAGVLDIVSLAGKNNPIIVDSTLTDVTGTSAIYISNQSRVIKYLSLQDIWNISPEVTLTSGIRFDNYSDFGNTINPRLALVWHNSDKLITKLLYGEAYRAPSFSELYTDNNPVTLGNKNLNPEEIKTTELSLNYTVSENWHTNLSLYHYKTKDMIEFVSNLEGEARAQNNKNLTGQGFELETSWKPTDKFNLSVNYAHQSTKTDNQDDNVEYVPQKQFYLDARWRINADWKLSTQLNWVMDRERAVTDVRTPLKDYKRLNVTLRRSGLGWGSESKSWEFSVALKNAFDDKIYEPSDGKISNDYLMHGRRIYVELSYKL